MGEGGGVDAEQRGQVGAQVAAGEAAAGQQPEYQQGGEQGVRAGVVEPERGGALGAGDGGGGDGGQGVAAERRVVGKTFDGEQPPVGGKADLPQGGQVAQPFPDTGNRCCR